MNKLKSLLQYHKFLFILLIITVFSSVIRIYVINKQSKYDINDDIIIGKVISYSIDGNLLKIKIKGKEILVGNYYIKSLDEKNFLEKKLKIGQKIKFQGELQKPINNTIPNTFNYKKYLEHQNIFCILKIDNYKILENGNFLDSLKNMIQQIIRKRDNSEYLQVFILGDKSLLDQNSYQIWQSNGTAHLLAISGMHIHFFIKFFKKLLYKFNKNIQFISILLILIFILFLGGFTSSVLRVLFCFILDFFNRKRIIPYSKMSILIFVFLIMLILNPFYIFNYGFLYSFVITGGLYYFNPKNIFSLSIVSFLFSLPISASLNYEINILSILNNLIIAPFVSFIVFPWALFTLFIPNSVWHIIILILNFLNLIFNKVSLFINIPKIPLLLILFYYVILLLLKNNHKYLIILILIIMITKIYYRMDSNYYVYFIDVGQGDSEILISPFQKEVIMIDTGGKVNFINYEWQEKTNNYFVSDNIILFLKSIGITKIDVLIISHGDYDHAGEALNLINKLKIGNIWLNKGNYNALEINIINNFKNINKKYNFDYFLVNNLLTNMDDNENDNSLVYKIKVADYNFLFLGDISKKKEVEIISKYNLNDVSFLKIAHHGSNTSTSNNLLKLSFKYAFISSGRNNIYHHPSKETIDNLKKYNKVIYNTQDNGTIKIKIKNKAYTIKCFSP